MADSDSDSSEFLGCTANDIASLNPQIDSDIDFTDNESGDEDIPIDELRKKISSRESEPPNWTRNLGLIQIDEFCEETGAVYTLPHTANELDFFNLIFPESLFDHLAEQTNLYAQQCTANKGDGNWRETNAEEIKAFIGIHVFMSIVQLPSYSNYWSTDSHFKIGSVPQIMTRIRFEKLLQYFHVNDSTKNPPKSHAGYDKLHHVRPVYTVVQDKLVECYNPHKNVSVNEARIPFRGCLSYKQYLPAKSCKFGIKVWELADCTNGYVYQMQVCTGKENGNSKGEISSRVVCDLTQILAGKYFHVNMDNFFSSPHLLDTLLLAGIYATGTCYVDRESCPDGLNAGCLAKEKDTSESYQDGNMIATSGFDKRQVNFISPNSDPTKTVSISRKQKDGNILHVPVPDPEVVFECNQHMNGVDHGDQLRNVRMQYPTARRSKKVWKYLFWYLFDTTLFCAYILMKESPNHVVKSKTGKQKNMTQQNFRQNLCKLLIGRFRQKRRYVISPQDQVGHSHWPFQMPKRRRCVECLKQKVRKESIYGCQICGVNLCVLCFEKYHLGPVVQKCINIKCE